MIVKYKVPRYEMKRYNKKVLYCEVLDKIEIANMKNQYIYKVKILNNNNSIDIINSNDTKKLNIIDWIKVGVMK